jgi:LysM repeat protein
MKLIIRAILVLTLLVASNVVVSAEAASAEALSSAAVLGYHTVRSGETLYCIGRAYGVQPGAIAAQNGIGWSSVLYIGQVLAIPNVAWGSIPAGPTCARQFDPNTPPPPPPPPPLCSAWYTVRYGDTLSGIAWWYGVNLYTLAARNNIYNLNLIFVGQTLCIP